MREPISDSSSSRGINLGFVTRTLLSAILTLLTLLLLDQESVEMSALSREGNGSSALPSPFTGDFDKPKSDTQTSSWIGSQTDIADGVVIDFATLCKLADYDTLTRYGNGIAGYAELGITEEQNAVLEKGLTDAGNLFERYKSFTLAGAIGDESKVVVYEELSPEAARQIESKINESTSELNGQVRLLLSPLIDRKFLRYGQYRRKLTIGRELENYVVTEELEDPIKGETINIGTSQSRLSFLPQNIREEVSKYLDVQ